MALVAVGCNAGDASPEASTETTAPTTTTTTADVNESPLPTDLSETYSIPGFGYSIDYPAGWFADTSEPLTVIVPTEEALAPGFSGSATDSLRVSIDHRTVAFLQNIGLTSDDPTAEDLLEFNTTLGWTDVRDRQEVELFNSSAIRVRTTSAEGGEGIAYQGVRTDTGEAYLVLLSAPSGEILDEFLPTWDAMFESITAIE